MGKKRIVTIGALEDEEEKRKKEQKKLQKKLEKERTKLLKKDKKEIQEETKEDKKEETREVKNKNESEKKRETDKQEELKKEVKTKIKKKTVSQVKVIKRSKNYNQATKLIKKDKVYSLDEAIELVKKTSKTKFDASIEMHIRLGVDKEKSEQNIRGTILLPAGTGKLKRVLVFTENKEKESKEAGADQVGGEELISKVEKGFSDFDIIIATPEIMPKIARLGKVLGQRGLMPNPKAGTITDKPAELIKEIKKGRIEFKMDSQGIIHQIIGKISFDNNQLKSNIKTLMEAILAAKPASIKGDYIKSIYICSTMGPSVKIKYNG